MITLTLRDWIENHPLFLLYLARACARARYEMNIIDYRGGKALLIDSLDIMKMISARENRWESALLKTQIQNWMKEVDYVLLITSSPPYLIRSLFQDLFNVRTRVNCYRFITKRGHKTVNEYMNKIQDELRETLKAVEDYDPQPEPNEDENKDHETRARKRKVSE